LDPDQEIFTGVNIADSTDQRTPELHQAEIRVEQLTSAALALTEQIVSRAGYSPQTFGLHIEGRAESGTALRVRESKTDRTTGRKQRYWAPELRTTITTLLDIGAEVFGTPTIDNIKDNPVKVEWPELQQDPKDKAEWINTLRTARAASIRTAVKLAQPDLEETAVDDEVALIMAEDQLADPTLIGRGPTTTEPVEAPAPGPDDFLG
jgi:hypothetical protein